MTEPIQADRPVAGFYKTRLVSGGPFVPASLADAGLDAFGLPIWRCRLGRDLVEDPIRVLELWPYLAKHPIDKDTYDFMVADAAHAASERPLDAKATPTRPVDWIGHNQPPSDDLIKAEALCDRADGLGAIGTIDDAHAAVDCVKQITVLFSRLDQTRKDLGKPHDEAKALEQAPHKEALLSLAFAKGALLPVIHDWRTAQGLPRISTDLGATAFERCTERVEITEPDKVPRRFCSPDPAKIELELRAGRDVPGAALLDEFKTVVS